tara:strand:+ start:13 stop:468 length:456 start_codon:yes stop_codon:yes gene_type:complete
MANYKINHDDFLKLAELYQGSENPLNEFETWDNVLTIFKHAPVTCASEDCYSKFEELPKEIILYRGILLKDNSDFDLNVGVSWTTDSKIAKMFAYRFLSLGGEACILKAEARKKDVLFYTDEREEREIIIDPVNLKNIHRINLIEIGNNKN